MVQERDNYDGVNYFATKRPSAMRHTYVRTYVHAIEVEPPHLFDSAESCLRGQSSLGEDLPLSMPVPIHGVQPTYLMSSPSARISVITNRTSSSVRRSKSLLSRVRVTILCLLLLLFFLLTHQ